MSKNQQSMKERNKSEEKKSDLGMGEVDKRQVHVKILETWILILTLLLICCTIFGKVLSLSGSHLYNNACCLLEGRVMWEKPHCTPKILRPPFPLPLCFGLTRVSLHNRLWGKQAMERKYLFPCLSWVSLLLFSCPGGMGDMLSAAIDSRLILSCPFVTAGFNTLSILGTQWPGSPLLPLPLSEASTFSSLCHSNSCSKAMSYPFQAHVLLQIDFPAGTFCFVGSNLLVFPRR